MVAGLTGAGPASPTASCWSAWTTATTPPWSGSTAARRSCSTADFFTPVVDDAYDWGRIAAANALSDVYAMGGAPLVAVNLLGWPRDVLPIELAAEVLRGGLDVAREAGCHVAGGHSDRRPGAEVRHGGHRPRRPGPAAAQRRRPSPGLPLTLTKPLGVGVLNNRHKATGEVFPEAVAAMTALNRDAGRRRRSPPASRAPPTSPASACSATCYKLAGPAGSPRWSTPPRCPTWTAPARRCADGFVRGGTRRNLDWVRPHTDLSAVDEDELLLLADAQTSGGLLVAGEIPGAPVIGELVPRGEHVVVIR